MTAPIDVARTWAARGVPAFPVAIGYDPTRNGSGGTLKRPLTAHGHLDATTDPPTLTAQFKAAVLRPGEVLAVGLYPGGAGLVVFDVDRHGERNGYVAAGELGLDETWGSSTPSGGEHRYYRRPDDVRIGNESPWADFGIDIRGDDGWVVAPGCDTEHGAWRKLADLSWPDDVRPIPSELLARLRTRPANEPRATTGWRTLTDEDRAGLDPATRSMLEHLETHHGAHSPILRSRSGVAPWVEVTRPGKRNGASATVGYIGPGVCKVFSSGWPDLPAGRYELDDDGRLLDEMARLAEFVGADVPGIGHVPGIPGLLTAELGDDELLDGLVRRELGQRRARQLADQLRAEHDRTEFAGAATTISIGTLDELRAQHQPVSWRIEGFQPEGGRVLLVAQRKTGKTTLAANYVRAVQTGEQFLGAFRTTAVSGTVAWLNYEMPAALALGWWADSGLDNPQFIAANLRGHPNPLRSAAGRAWLTEQLQAHDTRILVVDPFSVAYTGETSNDNDQVRHWLAGLDEFADTAGIAELLVLHHAGWHDGRSRGASALEDWADTIVVIERGTDDNAERRYLRAFGRDVDVPQDELAYDPATRKLTVTGAGSRAAIHERKAHSALDTAVLADVHAAPGLGVRARERRLKGTGITYRTGDVGKALTRLAEKGLVIEHEGPRNARIHTPTRRLFPLLPDCSPTSPTAPIGEQWDSDSRAVESGSSQHSENTEPETLVICAGCGRRQHPDDIHRDECIDCVAPTDELEVF